MQKAFPHGVEYAFLAGRGTRSRVAHGQHVRGFPSIVGVEAISASCPYRCRPFLAALHRTTSVLGIRIALPIFLGIVEEHGVARGHHHLDSAWGSGLRLTLSVVVQRPIRPTRSWVDLLRAPGPGEDGFSPFLRRLQVDEERGDAVVLHLRLRAGEVVVVGVVLLAHLVALDLQAVRASGAHELLALAYRLPRHPLVAPQHRAPRRARVRLVPEPLAAQPRLRHLHHLSR
mmetsp:Transcript_46510/g.88800  ORF Transcript_46510/g.88800 Transcript_46510/m.88800 type:complete len:230 (-) Transcript_46510:491-1180(-)